MAKTRLHFGSYGKPPYGGAASPAVEPEHADSWHVVVGGRQVALTKENMGKHMPNFLRYAYDAGVEDEKKRIASLLGVT